MASTPPPDTVLDPPGRRGWPSLSLLAVWGLGLLSYSNAFGGAFVYDDVRQVRDNSIAQGLDAFFAHGAGLRYLPTRWLGYATFAFNHAVGGGDPRGYHVFNVAVHLGCAALVHALVRLLFRTPRLRASAIAPLAGHVAFTAAALFVTHPLQTQAVTYIAQRLTTLATLFYLSAVVLYLRGRLAPAVGVMPPLVRGAGLFLLSAAAMSTKEISFTLPAALALVELSFLEGPPRVRLQALAPALAAWPIVPVTLLWARSGAGGSPASAALRADGAIPRLDYLITQPGVVLRYLGLLSWPAGQCLDHDVPVQHSLAAPAVVLPAVALLVLLVLAGFLYRGTGGAREGQGPDPARRLIGFGIFWFLLTLGVESSFIPIADVMYEHRVYLPSAGALIALAVGLALALRRLPRNMPARANTLVTVPVALVLSVAAMRRNTVWTDDLSLWTDSALCAPAKARPFANMGSALIARGHPDLGARALLRAVELDPSSSYIRAQLGAVLLSLRLPDRAEPQLREALRLAPQDAEASFNLATLLWDSGRRDEARLLYRRFLEIAPTAAPQIRRVAATRVGASSGEPPGSR